MSNLNQFLSSGTVTTNIITTTNEEVAATGSYEPIPSTATTYTNNDASKKVLIDVHLPYDIVSNQYGYGLTPHLALAKVISGTPTYLSETYKMDQDIGNSPGQGQTICKFHCIDTPGQDCTYQVYVNQQPDGGNSTPTKVIINNTTRFDHTPAGYISIKEFN